MVTTAALLRFRWGNSSFWGAKFIWTTLHDFGGTDGLKGWLAHINEVPFAGMAPEVTPLPPLWACVALSYHPCVALSCHPTITAPSPRQVPSSVWGTGLTPEGIDQNPVYYEFMLEGNWRTQRVADIPAHIVERSHRRYGLSSPHAAVTEAWQLLVNSSYSQDLSVQDGTGVPHLGGIEAWAWEADRHTASPKLCQVHRAWMLLNEASADIEASEPFRYDLVNTGREVLAQLAGPAGKNFSDAISRKSIDAAEVQRTSALYQQVLRDVDSLVGSDPAFLLGSWIEMAKGMADGSEDCVDTGYESISSCAAFYEWNARTQLTTWNPTPKGAAKIPAGPIDYAGKHWQGLIADYYAVRVQLVAEQALRDAANNAALNSTMVDAIEAKHAYDWTTATNPYPTTPVGDASTISKAMAAKYASFFSACA